MTGRDTAHLIERSLALSGQIESGVTQAARSLATCGSTDFVDRRPLGYQGTQCVIEGQDLDNSTASPIAGAATGWATNGFFEAGGRSFVGNL